MIKYKCSLLIPEEFMCVPSCILLIMDRLNIEIDQLKDKTESSKQFYLASMLDLRIPENQKQYFTEYNDELSYTITEDKLHAGCNVTDLNKQVFIPLNIPLTETFLTMRNFMYDENELFNTIDRELKNGNDIICFLDYAILSDDEENAPRGHAFLVNGINLERKVMTITNPITEREVIEEEIKIDDKLIESFKNFGYGGGISIISKNET